MRELHDFTLPDARTHLSVEDFDQIVNLAQQYAGIALTSQKRTLVSSRLAKLVRGTGEPISDYIDRATQDANVRGDLIAALTTNHTKFFREPHHFVHFRDVVRPQLCTALTHQKPVRLWSAGCSTGEEIYSLGMTLLGSDVAAAKRIASSDLLMLASDINRNVLRIGRHGSYAAEARSEIPAPLGKLWLEEVNGQFIVHELLRNLVRFRALNLIETWPIRTQFDAIFCRNTMIYFDAPTTERLQCRLADALTPGGYLYIGHSERLLGAATEMLETVGQTIFRKPFA